MGMAGQRHAPEGYSPTKSQVPILLVASWAPGPVWTDAENVAPTGFRSMDRAACSDSLYGLRLIIFRTWDN